MNALMIALIAVDLLCSGKVVKKLAGFFFHFTLFDPFMFLSSCGSKC